MDQQQQNGQKAPRGLKKLLSKFKSLGRSKKSNSQILETQSTPASSSTQPTTTPAIPQQAESISTSQAQPTPASSAPVTQSETADTTALSPKDREEPGSNAAPTSQTTTEVVATSVNTPAAIPDLAIVIEVDDGDDVEEMYVDNGCLRSITDLGSVLPERYTAGPYAADRARYERARAVFDKYNLKLEPAEWRAQSNANIMRVEKKPRMRVRWTCHSCNTTFGRDKVCVQCSHGRCNDCIRYPVRRAGDKAKKPIIIKPEPSAIMADVPTTGSCHECKTSFTIGDAKCSNCEHVVCERCLKETIMSSPATAPPSTIVTDMVAA